MLLLKDGINNIRKRGVQDDSQISRQLTGKMVQLFPETPQTPEGSFGTWLSPVRTSSSVRVAAASHMLTIVSLNNQPRELVLTCLVNES